MEVGFGHDGSARATEAIATTIKEIIIDLEVMMAFVQGGFVKSIFHNPVTALSLARR